jgi:ABC-type molybdate transport system ATPase subunit
VAVVAAAIVTDRHLMIAERALPIADVMTTDHVSAEPMTTMKIDIQSADVMMTMTIANAMMIHAIGAVLVTVVEVVEVEVEVEVEVLVVEVLVEVLVAVVVHSKTKAKVDPSPTNDVENMVCGLL